MKERADKTVRYVKNPDVVLREEGEDGGLLFNPDTDAILVINPTGALIWQALEKPLTRAEIVVALVKAYDNVPADQVDADVEAFLQTLQPGEFVSEVLE